MFKVLVSPFSGELQVNKEAHAVIVYESRKGQRILIQSIASHPAKRRDNLKQFEVWVQALNSSTSFKTVSGILRLIESWWRRDDTKRQRMLSFKPKPFYPSFSGHGGTGVDGYW